MEKIKNNCFVPVLIIIILNSSPIFAQIDFERSSTQLDYNTISLLEKNDDIINIVDDVSIDSISSYIEKLQQFNTRFETNDNRFAISEWIYNKFKTYGYTNVEYDSFSTKINYDKIVKIDSTYQQRNVVCCIPGKGAPEEKYILCAHYDSFSSNPYVKAPGADDNASGIAALLEIARVLKFNDKQLKRTVCFVALAGEELMNFAYSGSKHYAERLSSEGEDIKLVINHDMIGCTDKNISESSVNINRHINSVHYAELAILSVNNYTNITANHSSYWGADLGPFHDVGYNGVYFEENVFNPFYHSENDLLDNLNPSYCTEVIKGSCSFTVWATSMPNFVSGIVWQSIEGQNNALKISWNSNSDFDLQHYVVYWSEDGGNLFEEIITTDTTIIIRNDIGDFNNVRYAVAAKSSDGYESFAEIYELNITSVDLEEESNVLEEYSLSQNYPNPFNPSTIIEYKIQKNNIVKLTLYDTMGRVVKRLINEYKTRGNHIYTLNAEDLSSGVYYYGLSVGKYRATKKMIILR